MSNSYNILIPQEPFVDQTGKISRAWYRFLLNLFGTGGNGQAQINLDELEAAFFSQSQPDWGPQISSLESRFAAIRGAIEYNQAAMQMQQAAFKSERNEFRQRIEQLEAEVAGLRRPIDPPTPILSTGVSIPTIGTNKPGSAVTLTPQVWLTEVINGTTYYSPKWI